MPKIIKYERTRWIDDEGRIYSRENPQDIEDLHALDLANDIAAYESELYDLLPDAVLSEGIEIREADCCDTCQYARHEYEGEIVCRMMYRHMQGTMRTNAFENYRDQTPPRPVRREVLTYASNICDMFRRKEGEED